MSKRIWQHPEIPAEDTDIVSWRSVGELENSEAFRAHLEREFPEGSGYLSEEDREQSRRGFLKLMGASSALSGLALVSCRRPEAYIVPYKKAPEWVIPGKPLYYASTRPRAEGAVPLVVTTYEGRPTKLEPNRTHPDASGTDALTQASVLNLYDPERSRHFLNLGVQTTRETVSSALAGIARNPDSKLAILSGEDDCPTRNRLKDAIAEAYPNARFYSYEALRGAGTRAANRDVFGDGAEVVVDFEKADRILSLDCDFLATDPQGKSTDFSRRRQGGDADYAERMIDPAAMNRLYTVETGYSLTGGMADHRMRVAPSRIVRVAAEIARKIEVSLQDSPARAELRKITQQVPLFDQSEKEALFDGDSKSFDQWVTECAADLIEAAGDKKAVILAGNRQNEGLQRLVIAMNSALGAYEGGPLQVVKTGRAGYGTLGDLVNDLTAGTVDTVILTGPSNPVYDCPADVNFVAALEKAKVSIHLGLRTDATAKACTWHIPAAHYLESWSDARSATGVYSLVQPMILPLYGGVSELELLSQLLHWKDLDWAKVDSGEESAPVLLSGEGPEGAASPAYDEVRRTFADLVGEGSAPWKEALKNGFLAGSEYEVADLGDGIAQDDATLSTALQEALSGSTSKDGKNSKQTLEVAFVADASVWDGRYINNAWLQEAPDPISKLAWDNAAYVSPKTAQALNISKTEWVLVPESNTPIGKVANAPKPEINEGKFAKAPMATLTVKHPATNEEYTITIPVLVSFGHADNCVTIPLGYGQGATDGRSGVTAVDEEEAFPVVGQVGRNSGFNGNAIRIARQAQGGFYAVDAALEVTGKRYPVALLQEHHAMNGRALAREVSTNDVAHKSFEEQIAKVRKQGPVDSHAPENISLYKRSGSRLFEDDEAKQEDLISDKIHQWGMSIDLNTCIGCNSCLVACQAENNIPVVGKEQVAMGREMHWIRMDRYYATPAYERDDHGHIVEDSSHNKTKVPAWVSDNPELVPQPVACMQCENAPCETVCPVNATVHTEEGLNTMAYNRCIGTRYCANNCPYKARRFNYFDYNKRNPLLKDNLYKGPLGVTKVGEAPHLQRNPNVSVRMRGVMEKCTYCVQRLESAKIKQKQVGRQKALRAGAPSTKIQISAEDLRIATDSVKTACQDACPTDAISFGNLLDHKSKVWRAKYLDAKRKDGTHEPNPRGYELLQYIGAVPRTSYLARVKNPNAKMPDAKYRGLATIHTG